MIRFEWDSGKEKLNARKHGISFDEAESGFYDDYAIQFYDEDHSDEENRFLMLGLSNLREDSNCCSLRPRGRRSHPNNLRPQSYPK
jgi:uncharacterized DUF497 family protein